MKRVTLYSGCALVGIVTIVVTIVMGVSFFKDAGATTGASNSHDLSGIETVATLASNFNPATGTCADKRWRWQQNSGKTYQLSYTSDVPDGSSLDISGTLNVRKIKREGELHYVGFQLNPVQVVNQQGQRQSDIEALYQHLVFLGGYRAGGALFFSGIPHYIGEQRMQALKSLLELLQIQLPASGTGSEWQGPERDRLGQYTAHYQQAPSDCSISKQKTDYPPSPGIETEGAEAELRLSLESFDMQFTRNDFWFDKLQATQGLIHHATGTALLEQLDLNMLATPSDKTLALWSYSSELSGKALLEKIVLSTKKLPEELIAQLKTEQAKQAFKDQDEVTLFDDLLRDSWNRQTHADTVDAMYKFSKYLELYPEKTFEVPALLENIADDDMSARVIHALGVSGTPQAQAVLVGIVADSEQANHKLQSVVALGAVEQPDPETINALWSIADGNVAELRDDISNDNTALLALGRAAETLAATDPDASQAIVDGLLAKRDAYSGDSDKTLALLESLNNTGLQQDEIKNAALSSTSNHDYRVRQSVADILADYQDATVTLVEFLYDPSESVRKTAVESLAYQAKQFTDKSAVEVLTQQLAIDQSQSARITLIRELDKLRAEFPQVEDDLREHQRNEPSANLSNMIDTLLSREAVRTESKHPRS